MTEKSNKALVLVSGGLDSSVVLSICKLKGYQIYAISFDYGQRHRQEIKAAQKLAKFLQLAEYHLIKVDLASWGGSSLTDLEEEIPTAGLQENVIPSTYVPGRNTVFIAIGLSLAEAKAADHLVLGINAMDYSGYPDCREDYLKAYQVLANLASKAGRSGHGAKLWAPLIHWNKVKIVQEALRLGIPIQQTWSCYREGNRPCGICDSCRIRDTALRKAGRKDLCSTQQ